MLLAQMALKQGSSAQVGERRADHRLHAPDALGLFLRQLDFVLFRLLRRGGDLGGEAIDIMADDGGIGGRLGALAAGGGGGDAEGTAGGDGGKDDLAVHEALTIRIRDRMHVRAQKMGMRLVGPPGLEPGTSRLKVACSTD